MEIFSIIKANMKSKKGTMFSIFLLLFLITLSLITVLSINRNANKRYDEASRSANVPDLTAVFKTNLLPENFREKLEKDQSVDYVNIVPKIYVNDFKVSESAFHEIQGIGVYQPAEHSYEIFKADELELWGNKQVLPKDGEIFVPIGSKNRYKCELGDTITYTFADGSMHFKIAKFIEEPYSGCTLMGMKRVFINEQDYQTLEKLRGISEVEVEIYYTEQNTDLSDTILRRLSQKENLSELGDFILTKDDSRMFTMIFTNILSGILLAFSMLLFVVILIIIGFSVNMSIEMDYGEYGILKSQGFTTMKLRIILLIQYLVSGSIGCLLGFLLSGLGIRYMSGFFIPITGLFISNKVNVNTAIIVILPLLILLAAFILLITKKLEKVYPIQAIRGRIEKGYSKLGMKMDISQISNLPLSIRLSAKSLLANLKEYISMVFIIGILLFFLIVTASIGEIKNYDNVRSMFGGSPGEIQLLFKDTVRESLVVEVEKVIREITPVTKIFKSDLKYLSVDGLRYLGNVVNTNGILKEPYEGTEPKNEDEIVITGVLSGLLNKGIGDTVTISLNGVRKQYVIVGLNQDTSDVGKCFGILEKGVQRLDKTYQIKNVDILIEDKTETPGVIELLKSRFNEEVEGVEISNQYQSILDQSGFIIVAIDAVTALIFMLALFFVGIITFIICSKAFVKERVDMGILKSVGFSTREIRGQFAIRFLMVSLIGSALGLFINLILGRMLLGVLFSGMGMNKMELHHTVIDYMVPVLFICGFTVVFAWLSSGRIKRVSPKNLINL